MTSWNFGIDSQKTFCMEVMSVHLTDISLFITNGIGNFKMYSLPPPVTAMPLNPRALMIADIALMQGPDKAVEHIKYVNHIYYIKHVMFEMIDVYQL